MFSEIAILDNRLIQHIAKTKHDFKKNLLSSLTCSQIWLIPIVSGGQCGHITKLKEKNLDHHSGYIKDI